MKVVAIETGFYGNNRRRAGSTFELKDGDKLGKWMKPVDQMPEGVVPPAEVSPDTLSGMAKAKTITAVDAAGKPVTPPASVEAIQADADAKAKKAQANAKVEAAKAAAAERKAAKAKGEK